MSLYTVAIVVGFAYSPVSLLSTFWRRYCIDFGMLAIALAVVTVALAGLSGHWGDGVLLDRDRDGLRTDPPQQPEDRRTRGP